MRKLFLEIGMGVWLVACAPRVGEPKSPEPAACDDGKGPSCVELAERYHHGTGIQKSPAKALELYLLACQHDVARGCSVAGDISLSGAAGPMDAARAWCSARKPAC